MYVNIFAKDEKGVWQDVIDPKPIKAKSLEGAKRSARKVTILHGLKPLGKRGYKMTFIRSPLAWRMYTTVWGEDRMVVITRRNTL